MRKAEHDKKGKIYMTKPEIGLMQINGISVLHV